MFDEIRQHDHIIENDLPSIVKYGLAVQNICAMIKSSRLEGYASNPLILEEIVEKLPKSLQFAWAQAVGDKEISGLNEFDSWLSGLTRNLCKNLGTIDISSADKKQRITIKRRNNTKEDVHVVQDKNFNSDFTCFACSGSCKNLSSCDTFKLLNDDCKWQVIKRHGICRQCLKQHKMKHPFICENGIKCDVANCNGTHHPLMHRDRRPSPKSESSYEHVNYHIHVKNTTVFRYIPVRLMNQSRSVDVIAFLDCGSTGTFLEHATAKELGLKGPKSSLHLKFSGNSHHTENDSMSVSCNISGVHKDAKTYTMNDIHTIKNLNLREQQLQYEQLEKRFDHLKNLPITSYNRAKPAILIGLRHWKLALEREIRVDDENDSPIASKCMFGWSIYAGGMAYVHLAIRTMKNSRLHNQLHNKEIDSDLLKKAEHTIIRICQSEGFPIEIAHLKTGKLVPRDSKIYKSSPYLDNDGIIRSKGRIDAAQCVGNDTKRPILLPPHHYVTQLLLEKYHNEYKHLHHETVINEFRQKYMVKSARRLLKHIRNHCPTCAYLNAKPEPPEMAPLPHARLAAYMRPFTYVGIDCMGPLTVTIGRRSEKRWICLYTCLTIRAIHLEVLYKMDASSFIMSYRNFTQRRGAPSEVYLDNGSNFVGGERLMREELAKVDMKEVAAHFTSPETKWKFNPPDSPHMGGSWERLVKSVKTAFYATKPERNLTDPLLYSYMVEVENIVNSRPLTYMPLDEENEEALTPNHFLKGDSSGQKPLCRFTDDVKYVKDSWRLSQLYTQRYWERWVKEYLPELTCRTKWHCSAEPLKVNDIVMIIDPNSIRNCWPKARIIAVRTGQDGQVRSASVKLANGSILERPVVKLAKLKINGEPNLGDPNSLTVGEDVNKSIST
uniref:CSON002426 protein n=1 Tax=Culicoides sonorensis TaxID=179676 RepID=A0A336MNL5_CULSO